MMLKQLIRQFFSNKCQLTCLRLDIADDYSPINIHQCLIVSSHPSTNTILNKMQYCCLTLRHLYICIKYTCFLEHLIEHIPNIERLSVTFKRRMDFEPRSKLNMQTLIKSSENWSEKVRRIYDNLVFSHLFWVQIRRTRLKIFHLHFKSFSLATNCFSVCFYIFIYIHILIKSHGFICSLVNTSVRLSLIREWLHQK